MPELSFRGEVQDDLQNQGTNLTNLVQTVGGWAKQPRGLHTDLFMNDSHHTLIIIGQSPWEGDGGFLPLLNMQCMYSHVF